MYRVKIEISPSTIFGNMEISTHRVQVTDETQLGALAKAVTAAVSMTTAATPELLAAVHQLQRAQNAAARPAGADEEPPASKA
jgi:hypothetical protein